MPPRTKVSSTEPTAQTTVRIPHTLLKRARIRAATDEVTLQALLVAALERELIRRERAEVQRAARSANSSKAATR